MSDKLSWEGRIISVQPRIRLLRSFDERSHSYLGYSLLVEGRISGREGKFRIGIGKAAQSKNQFRVGDIHKLDLADNTFDGCRADRVFMHLHDRQQALSEMIRVTRPGGRIVVVDPDWDTMIVEAPDRDLTRRIIDNFVDQLVLNPWCGRESYKLFQQAGLENVAVADTATLVLTDFSTAKQLMMFDKAANLMLENNPSLSDKIELWLSYLQQADDGGFFFSAATMFTVVGEKPFS